MKEVPKQQDLIRSVYNIEDIALSDIDEEEPWESISGNEQITSKDELHFQYQIQETSLENKISFKYD